MLPQTLPGAIGTDQALCTGGDPMPLTSDTAASGTVPISYRWESSTDTGMTWDSIPGANASTYDPAALSVATGYRRVAIADFPGDDCETYSNVVSIAIGGTNPPTALCKDAILYLDTAGMATLAVTEIDSDNCSVGSLSLSKTSFNFSNLGANTVSLSVTDGSGNNSTCTATVTVTDVTAPQALCKAATMILDAGGNGILTIAAVNKNSADAGDSIAKLSLSKTSYNCANLGANVVTLTVTDQGGNTATCQSTVTVAGPQLTIEVTPTDCGDYNGSVTMTVTGGNGQPDYSIDGGQNYKLINTYTGLTGGLYSAVVTFFGGTGCTLPAVPVVISSGAPDTNTWTGAGDGVNWSDKANWSTGFVPLSCHNVIIPPGHNVVVPNGVNALGRTLLVDMGSTVTLEPSALMDILPY